MTPSSVQEVLSDSWIYRLFLNVLGYATVAVPGALIIYYVKKKKRLDASGCLSKALNLFVNGNEPDKPSLELGETRSSSPPIIERSLCREALVILYCFGGLLFSYLIWGLLQEKIMTQSYKDAYSREEKFTDSQFLVFVNRVLAFLFAGTYIMVKKQPRHIAPFYKYSYCSFSNILSSWCQYEALKYVSFPTQVLAKASKIIPVMLMGKLVSRKTYDCYEYVIAGMISVGMTLFLLSRNNDDHVTKVTTVSGVIILAGYMVLDSFTSNWQNELFNRYKVSSMQMMCGVNLFSCILTFISLLQQGAFLSSLQFMFVYHDFFYDCLFLSVCSTVGQLFVFNTISRFGPVAFVIMMTIRQAIAILLSCIIYHHAVAPLGILGIVIIFVAIFTKIYYGQRKRLKIPIKEGKAKLISNGQNV